jgi:hypothetical protein
MKSETDIASEIMQKSKKWQNKIELNVQIMQKHKITAE